MNCWMIWALKRRVRSGSIATFEEESALELSKFWDSNLRIIRRRTQDPGLRHWQLNDDAGLSERAAHYSTASTPRTHSGRWRSALLADTQSALVRTGPPRARGRSRRFLRSVGGCARNDHAAGVWLPGLPVFVGSRQVHRDEASRPIPSTDIHPQILALCDDLSRRLDSLVT